MRSTILGMAACGAILLSCSGNEERLPLDALGADSARVDARVRPEIYASVRLTTDTSGFTPEERRMLLLLMEAADIMDSLFWLEAWGMTDSLPAGSISGDARRFFQLNYGPWDRLDGNKPFIEGVGAKPAGARFYPADMSKQEFETCADSSKTSLYTLVRRDAARKLVIVPYHVAFAAEIGRAAHLLTRAADLAADDGLRNYLQARAAALLNDQYDANDRAWLDMRRNRFEAIIGPIETYEDQLYGYKAAHAAYIAVKDMEWSRKLERFARLLPELQRGLPVPDDYKKEEPGSDSQLGAYDVIYYAGDCNAGSKTIAVNLPNDERIQLEKGTRRLQFKNAMRAKFDRILVPISDLLVAEDQRKHVTFDAFFEDVMFHEVAHGLGIKNTINGRGTVRDALKEEAGALEEGKADMLGLYMVKALREKGEIASGTLLDDYVTFMAGVFRSVRFGASSAHGRANILRFNFFLERGAFVRDAVSGTYRVDEARMEEAMNALSALILTIQGDGDLERVKKLMAEMGSVRPELQADLDRLRGANIPVDVVFEQGASVLGLEMAR